MHKIYIILCEVLTMEKEIIAGLIGILGAMVGSIITGIFSYKIATINTKYIKLKQKLLRALEDIQSLRGLEELYINEIIQIEKKSSKKAVKIKIWSLQRQMGKNNPSKMTESAQIKREIENFKMELD